MILKDSLSDLKGILFDMDGVLWRGSKTLPGFKEIFEIADRKNIPYSFITNNSSSSPDKYSEKFKSLGVTVLSSRVITAGLATLNAVKEKYADQLQDQTVSVYVLGSAQLRAMFKEAGFKIVDSYSADIKVDVVVIGIFFEIRYEHLATACLYLNKGALFAGCNPDKTYPSEQGLTPGTGSLIAMLEHATGLKSNYYGKPSKFMYEQAINSINKDEAVEQYSRYLVVGDRLDTDVTGAKNLGLKSALVLSGVTTKQDLETSNIKPDLVLSGVDELARLLEETNGTY